MTKKKTAIKKAKNFLDPMKAAKQLRDAIADIMAQLNRSNLSADEGKRLAKELKKAYRKLKNLEK